MLYWQFKLQLSPLDEVNNCKKMSTLSKWFASMGRLISPLTIVFVFCIIHLLWRFPKSWPFKKSLFSFGHTIKPWKQNKMCKQHTITTATSASSSLDAVHLVNSHFIINFEWSCPAENLCWQVVLTNMCFHCAGLRSPLAGRRRKVHERKRTKAVWKHAQL